MESYKIEIEQTRIGCLGSSDAQMVAMIQNLGNVPKSSYERLAIVKGFRPPHDHSGTDAMKMGDRMENEIYAYLTANGAPYESNPLWVSKKYSRPNVKAISHPDFVLKDEDAQTLNVYEVKASKFPTSQVRQEYRCQLFWHYQLAIEQAKTLGKGWKVKLFLVHYDTSFIDDFYTHEFEISRLTIQQVRFHSPLFDIAQGMDIISQFLETFNEYYESDEVDANMLPEKVYSKFLVVCDTLTRMKQMEEDVETFKKRIYEFMQEKNIKAIKNEVFCITRVDPTESVSFDYKRFLEDYAAKHPTKARAIKRQYEKRTQRKGYATIKVKK